MKSLRISALLVFLAICLTPSHVVAGEAETKIVGECAAQSGGEPANFAACALKQLTIAEIKKCFDGTGCFGPGNTIVQFNDWFNRTILGNCGAFHSQSAKQPQFLVLNNSNSSITFAAEGEYSERTDFNLEAGQMALLSFDWCDTWVNIYGAGESYNFDMGGVMEFAADSDGNIKQYVVIKK